MEKCRIFLFGIGETFTDREAEVNEFLADGKKIITRVLQSSAAWDGIEGRQAIGTHLTIFYEEK